MASACCCVNAGRGIGMIDKKKVKMILLVCLIFLFLFMALSGIGGNIFDPEAIRKFVTEMGAMAPVVFSLLFLVIVLLGLPPTLMTTSSGVLFGPVLGIGISVVCVNLGGFVIFTVSRKLGRKSLQKYLSEKFQKLENGLRDHGFMAVVIARLSFVPFALVCISAALSSVRKEGFLLGTFIGTFPAIFMLCWLGDAALQMFKTGDLSPLYHWQGAVSVALFIVALMVPIFYEKTR